ncbi:MAG: Fic family protein, partial [Christensenellaceae bacterium]|nr:Fic family protein [Christensenellaceae bacterium]
MRNNANFITTKLTGERWGMSARRIRLLCEENRIAGAIRSGKSWLIPFDAKRPTDERYRERSLTELYLQIEIKKQELNKRRPLTTGELERLTEQFAVEFTYNSNAIEGNTLTLNETELVLRGLTVDQKPLKDHLEVTQHKEAFDFVCGLVREREQLTTETIKKIHSIILNNRPDDRGVYRNVQVRILGSVHIPPQPYKIDGLMSELIKLPNTNIAEVAKFHLEFERIHPFVDGNGRTGRLLANF